MIIQQKHFTRKFENVKDLFSDDDPVKVLINEADKKSVTGDYMGALYVAQEALKKIVNRNTNICQMIIQQKHFTRKFIKNIGSQNI